MDNIFLGKKTTKVSTKVPAKAKDLIQSICAKMEITESQFVTLALQKQIEVCAQYITPQNPMQ